MNRECGITTVDEVLISLAHIIECGTYIRSEPNTREMAGSYAQ